MEGIAGGFMDMARAGANLDETQAQTRRIDANTELEKAQTARQQQLVQQGALQMQRMAQAQQITKGLQMGEDLYQNLMTMSKAFAGAGLYDESVDALEKAGKIEGVRALAEERVARQKELQVRSIVEKQKVADALLPQITDQESLDRVNMQLNGLGLPTFPPVYNKDMLDAIRKNMNIQQGRLWEDLRIEQERRREREVERKEVADRERAAVARERIAEQARREAVRTKAGVLKPIPPPKEADLDEAKSFLSNMPGWEGIKVNATDTMATMAYNRAQFWMRQSPAMTKEDAYRKAAQEMWTGGAFRKNTDWKGEKTIDFEPHGKEGGEKGPATPETQEEYNDLPSGTEFIDPSGKLRRKP